MLFCAAISPSFKYHHCVQYEFSKKKHAVFQAAASYSSRVASSYSEPQQYQYTIWSNFVVFWIIPLWIQKTTNIYKLDTCKHQNTRTA